VALRNKPWFTLALGVALVAVGASLVRDSHTLSGVFLLLIGFVQFPLAAHQAKRPRLSARHTVIAVAAGFAAMGLLVLIDAARSGSLVGAVAAVPLLAIALWLFIRSNRAT
jgi:low temperature requirement protein LtrA